MSRITFLNEDELNHSHNHSHRSQQPIISNESYEDVKSMGLTMEQKHAMNINCATIANHITVCPICSKFYECDKKPQNVTIIILVIICLILMKKILKL